MVKGKACFVRNDILERDVKRFFAMCGAVGLNSENQKNYYKERLGVTHIADITADQWTWIFKDMQEQMAEQARDEGTVFTTDLDKTIAEILGD